MRFTATARILGILLMFFSLSMLTPIPVSIYYHEADSSPFVIAFAITFLTGLILWAVFYNRRDELRTRDGFFIVFLIWVVLGLFGALPFVLSYSPKMPFSDAVFETVSGLTTTGATALANIDGIPRAILYYRQQLQFLGGMGIIVLAIAIMPLIGVGGMQLYKAETTGPMKDNKITPRIMETAKALWIIYVGLTVACALAYWAFGMSLFDAISYAFGTVSTGGYAPHNASIAYYSSNSIYIISIIFMLLGGTNFSLHFLAFRRLQLKAYWSNAEFRFYIYLFLVLSLIVTLTLIVGEKISYGKAVIDAFYQVVSFGTTTGFVSDTNYAHWPFFLPILLMFIGMCGACAGSTTGGVKAIRLLLFKKQVSREINRLIHPKGMFPVKLGNSVVPDRVLSGVWAFAAAYTAIFIFLWLLLMATGLDSITAFSAVAACIANAGPGLGKVASNYSTLNHPALWVLSLAMLVGRLEVFTVLVLLSPKFWRR